MWLFVLATLLVGLVGVLSLIFAAGEDKQQEEVVKEEEDKMLNFSNDNWELTQDQIARLAQGKVENYDSKQAVEFLELHCSNLRSKLCVDALQALGIYLPTHCSHFNFEDWRRVCLMLLQKCTNDKKFIASAARQTLNSLQFKEKFPVLMECAAKNLKHTKLVVEAVSQAASAAKGEAWSVETAKLVFSVEDACKNAQAKQVLRDLIMLHVDDCNADEELRKLRDRLTRPTTATTTQVNKPWKQ